MQCVLLIHGFAGSRKDVQPIYDFLTKKGYMVSMPVLSGHEATPKELALATREQWLSDVENAYLKLSEKCDNISVIGFSMGALLAVNLYQKYKFNKLVLINTPVYYWNIKQIFKNLNNDPKAFFSKYIYASTHIPLSALCQFQRLLSETKPLFKTINCDTLVIQLQDDDTVNSNSADFIFNQLQGKKSIYKPEIGGHIVFQGEYYDKILQKIYEFLIK